MVRTLRVLDALPSASCESGLVSPSPPRPVDFDRIPGELVDALGRRITYVRLSVTDRCDLACVYCMPSEGEREHERRAGMLDFEEIARLAALLERSGVRRLRFTGGEPLLRRDVVQLVQRVHERAPALRLALTTNGTRLSELARPLAEAGLESVNVSIDSLNPVRFAAITRGGSLPVVVAGVHAALEAGLELKTNAVVLGRRSLEEIPALIDWAWSLGVTPRFIELMPIGEAAKLDADAMVPAVDIAAAIAQRAALQVPSDGAVGPATYLESRDGRRVGLIAATTRPFCETCNRVRLTARGELRGCLGSPRGVSLRELLRGGEDDLGLAWALHSALRTKAVAHTFAYGTRGAHLSIGMSLVGG